MTLFTTAVCAFLYLFTSLYADSLASARALFLERDPLQWFLTRDGKPTEALKELLELDDLYDPNDSLSDIVTKTQKKWVQVQAGKDQKERIDLIDSDKQQKLRQRAEKIASQMGLFAVRAPCLKQYDYGICLGGFLYRVRDRLFELVQMWQSGVRFNSLIFLTGERYLRKNTQDCLDNLLDEKQSRLPFKPDWSLPKDMPYETEYDMCRLVWDQVEIPPDMRVALGDKVIFINAPRPIGQERPTTKETYQLWLTSQKPAPGTVLASSAPIVWAYQQLAGENMLGPDYPLDTCAPAASPEVLQNESTRIVSLVQDTAAKVLFEAAPRFAK